MNDTNDSVSCVECSLFTLKTFKTVTTEGEKSVPSEDKVISKQTNKQTNKQTKTPWPESAGELYRPSDRRLSAKLVSASADRGSRVVSVTDPYGRILATISSK
jgi:hypothetical protein